MTRRRRRFKLTPGEQICTSHAWFCESPGYRKFCKRVTARAYRHSGKADPENAPTRRVYRGYSC